MTNLTAIRPAVAPVSEYHADDRLRMRACVHGWRLREDAVTLSDDDGRIATFARTEDACFILGACHEYSAVSRPQRDKVFADVTDGAVPTASPAYWCRDPLADGTESYRQLRDGLDRPIITLDVDHPRSSDNEDFILYSRNERSA